MAETCNLGRLTKPQCNSAGNVSLSGLNINIQKASTVSSSVRVEVKAALNSEQIVITDNTVHTIVFNQPIQEGVQVSVEVYSGTNLMGSGQKTFTFERTNYAYIRGIKLEFLAPGIQVNFENW